MESVKCVVVGDRTAGKTSLLYAYASNLASDSENTPGVLKQYGSNGTLDGNQVHLQLWDMNSQEEYARLRLLSYPQTDVFVICFSVVEPLSRKNVKQKWFPEIRQHCPSTPIVLVGTKATVRDEQLGCKNQIQESQSKGLKMAKKIGAVKYLECSFAKGIGVKEIFDEAIRSAQQHKQGRRSWLFGGFKQLS